LRRDALSSFGHVDVRTPNIDSLAESGVSFINACSTYPICVPFRFSLMTGEHAHSRYVPAIDWRMSPAERTVAHEFGAAGYETAYVGKWHLYGAYGVRPGVSEKDVNRTPVPRPHQGGFERWFGFELRNDPWDTCYFVDDDPEPRPIHGFQTDGLFDIALDFLATRRDPGRPFLLVLSIEPPHPPYDAPEEFVRAWEGRPVQLPPNFQAPNEEERLALLGERRNYCAAIENLDANVGRLVGFLEDAGLKHESVVVFVADHGELGGSHGLREKQYPYEESIGIPLIVADWTHLQQAGRTLSELVCTEDLFPTLLGLAGQGGKTTPGTDLTPLMRGHAPRLPREGVLLEFVSEFRPNMPFYRETWRGVRTERYKYTVLGAGDVGHPWQLFDLERDPYELTNLVADPAHSSIMQRHHSLLKGQLKTTGDHYRLAF
jgi:arylsulfatase A-like enzyme